MKLILITLFSCLSLLASSQMNDIVLMNPSFEDSPRKGGRIESINGWYDCGFILFPRESPPDIHPAKAWGVDSEPYDGATYLGLVVRDNDSWESVSQKLALEDGTLTPMQGGHCYALSMAVLQSEKYISGSRYQYLKNDNKLQTFNYNKPAIVRIWGGNSYCNKLELLASSGPIDNQEWKVLDFNFTPNQNYEFITLEAYYQTPVLVPYNGHVLIDGLSNISEVTCE